MTIKRNNTSVIIYYLVVFDILFLPYFKIIPLPLSGPLIILWAFYNVNYLLNQKRFKIYIVLFSFAILSILYSYFKYHEIEYYSFYANIKKTIQFGISFIYYFYFRKYLEEHDGNIRTMLIVFIIFGVLLALLYINNFAVFLSLKRIWNSKDSFINFYEQDPTYLFRYNFTWTDPNNPAYAFTSVFFFLLGNYELSLVMVVMLFICLTFLLIASMSHGAFIAFLFTMLIFIISNVKSRRGRKYSFIVAAIVLIFYAAFSNQIEVNWISSQEVVDTAIKRIQTTSPESRYNIWTTFLEAKPLINYLFIGEGIGEGNKLLLDGMLSSPHSGHLYLIYCYGILGYLLFIILFFVPENIDTHKISRYIFILPTFIGFTINIIIGEQKYFILEMLLLALVSKEVSVKESMDYIEYSVTRNG